MVFQVTPGVEVQFIEKAEPSSIIRVTDWPVAIVKVGVELAVNVQLWMVPFAGLMDGVVPVRVKTASVMELPNVDAPLKPMVPVSVGLAVGALALICVWMDDVTPFKYPISVESTVPMLVVEGRTRVPVTVPPSEGRKSPAATDTMMVAAEVKFIRVDPPAELWMTVRTTLGPAVRY